MLFRCGSLLAAWCLLWLGVTLRPAAPPEKASRPRPHFAAAAPLPLFRGASGRSPPPTQTIPPMARCVNAPSCSPKKAARPRPHFATAAPLPLFRGQAVASPLPHPAAAEGQAGQRPHASAHQPAPPLPLPVQPPQGGFPFIISFPLFQHSFPSPFLFPPILATYIIVYIHSI